MNILVNSGFLLRVSEWQTESSVLTLRIKGKQWYWVYKFDWLNLSTGSIGLGRDVGSSQRYTQNFLKNFDSVLYKYLMGHYIRQYFLKRHAKFRLNLHSMYDDVVLKINKANTKNLSKSTKNINLRSLFPNKTDGSAMKKVKLDYINKPVRYWYQSNKYEIRTTKDVVKCIMVKRMCFRNKFCGHKKFKNKLISSRLQLKKNKVSATTSKTLKKKKVSIVAVKTPKKVGKSTTTAKALKKTNSSIITFKKL